MAVSVIDGTLESVTVKRKASRVWRLHDLVFRTAAGGETRLDGMTVVTPDIGVALQPGVNGRFYVYRAIDHKGIHAVRSPDGSVLMKFPRSNETLMAVLFFINIAAAAAMFAIDGSPNWLTVALIPFTSVLWFLYRAARREAEAQVIADRAPVIELA